MTSLWPERANAADGDTIVAFDSIGHLDATADVWTVPVHGWVYRVQDSVVRKRAIASLFERQYGLTLTEASRPFFDRRVNLLLADNKRARKLTATLADTKATLPPTGANGHAHLDLRLGVSHRAPAQGGILSLDLKGAEQTARVRLLASTGLSIISDIDDTVKASGVLDKAALWKSTFFEPFKAVPDMADLIRRVGGTDAAVHYVSSSPWHFYAPLLEWLRGDGFAVTSLHLKQIRLKDASILDILKSPAETKPPIIAGLLARFPRRRFVLLGDSGEKDPEVYAAIARRFPQQIERILIRRAPGDRSPSRRFEGLFAHLPAGRWQVFDSPREVADGAP